MSPPDETKLSSGKLLAGILGYPGLLSVPYFPGF
jgi:hypothetical protein